MFNSSTRLDWLGEAAVSPPAKFMKDFSHQSPGLQRPPSTKITS